MRNRAMISSILGMALFMGCADELPTPSDSSGLMGPSHLTGDDNGLSESPEDPASESEGNDPTGSS